MFVYEVIFIRSEAQVLLPLCHKTQSVLYQQTTLRNDNNAHFSTYYFQLPRRVSCRFQIDTRLRLLSHPPLMLLGMSKLDLQMSKHNNKHISTHKHPPQGSLTHFLLPFPVKYIQTSFTTLLFHTPFVWFKMPVQSPK